jgi:hypothetical protein
MICPNCRKVYNNDDVYCVACGARLVEEVIPSNSGNPMERFSSRVKKSKPKEDTSVKVNPQFREISSTDNKLDVLILQNKELIKQNNRIIELLEKLTR